ncbi:MAG: IS701 family transposase, partial [Chloroflexi bacterium]|nr:IS701 family transposase [Chloroflexota bacterium]
MTEITEDRIATWREGLEALVAQIGPLFRRSEVRARVGPVLRGLLGSAERKNGWQLAEAIGEDDPHGVQRLLAEAVWDADAARDVLRRYVTTHLGTPEGALVVDETGFLKKGERSVGVARQDSGTAGKVENCQVPVFLTYAGERGHAFLDRALYLPRAWTDDPLRLRAAGVPHAWVLGDSVYGDDGDLRADLEARGEAYALGVSASHVIWEGGEGREARALIAALPPAAWARLSAGRGSQGERLFDWCWLRLTPSDDRGMARWLVARRTLGEKPEVAYFRVYGPAASSLATLALAIGAPWTIEDCIAEAKGLTGLDEYEVRGWVPWHRHVTLALLAHA